MRILVVGAGGVGGYFGGRLSEAGNDVTFLVRHKRAAQIKADGLVIKSSCGDATLPVPTVLAENLNQTFDLILLSCKAYDLDSAIESFAPAVGPQTAILPLLNGMRHLDVLDRRFGAEKVLGGSCQISATLDANGHVLHLNNMHLVIFGERNGVRSDRVNAIADMMAKASFESRASDIILLEMWEKWVFLAALAGITCLMRATIGDIVAAGNADLSTAIFEECRLIAEQQGYTLRPAFVERILGLLTAEGSSMAASMLRDLERNGQTEVDHVIGDLLQKAQGEGVQKSVLRIAHAHLQAYETRRLRQLA